MIMEKCAVYEDGEGIAVVHPSPALFDPNSLDRHLLREYGIDFASEEEIYTWIFNKDIPEGKSYKVINISDLPSDRTFRAAWRLVE